MKKILTSLFFGSLAFGIIYLVGSFGNYSFLVSHWNGESRLAVCIFGVISFLGAFITAYNEFDDFNNKKL